MIQEGAHSSTHRSASGGNPWPNRDASTRVSTSGQRLHKDSSSSPSSAARIGQDLRWEALDQTREGKFIFHIEAGLGWGMVVEEKEHADGEFWRARVAFRCLTLSGLVLDATLIMYRWDEWLSAEATGDRSLIEGSPSRRRRIANERRAKSGALLDTVKCKWLALANASHDVLGVPASHLVALKDRRDRAISNESTTLRVGKVPRSFDDGAMYDFDANGPELDEEDEAILDKIWPMGKQWTQSSRRRLS